MRGLASFIMHGRLQATSIVVITALLPLVNILSGAALALVTLRRGYQEGVLIMALAVVSTGLLLGILSGTIAPAVGVLGLFWLPLWLLAVVLRYTVSLATTLQLALLLASLALLGYGLALGDPVLWGRMLLEQVFGPLLRETGLTATTADMERIVDYLAPLTLGLIFANGLASLLLSLLLGRWWQSLLYNPGGFGKEFHELRLGRQLSLMAMVLLSLALITDLSLIIGLALLLLIVYTLQGLAIVHGIAGKLQWAKGWLIGLYVLLFFALPQMVVILCLLGISDAWLDFRARVGPSVRQ